MIEGQAVVTDVERLSPGFVRIELGGPDLAEFGVAGPTLDQRIKLLFGAEQLRRTYTVRAVRPGPRVVVDFVLHLDPDSTGPASQWASRAAVGDTVGIIAPRRGVPFGGIEFDPGPATRVLLAADETAVPAVAAILEQVPGLVGEAYLEVPSRHDVLPLTSPPGVEVHWLPREGAPHGALLVEAVRHATAPRSLVSTAPVAAVDTDDLEVWETPTYSSSGDALTDAPVPHAPELYAWVAGESRAVTTIRRHLVTEVGLERRQVAFMGYWRQGGSVG